MTPRLVTQTLKRSELQLLDRAFTPSQFLCDFTDASLIHKSPHHHQALVCRKPIDQLVQHGSPLGFGSHARFSFRFVQRVLATSAMARLAPSAIAERVSGNP
jgi:hypothetical protein